MTDYTILAYSEVVSPLTHMAGTSGNEALINTERKRSRDQLVDVPVLSGNAIRHRCVREPGAYGVIRTYGLDGLMNKPMLVFLNNGGRRTEKSALENIGRIETLRRLFPLVGLLGGTLPDQIVPGNLDVLRGVLVCEENRLELEHLTGGELPQQRLRSAMEFTGAYQYTTSDPSMQWGKPLEGDDGRTNTIFGGQTVISGSAFVHGFRVRGPSPEMLGALFLALESWERSGGTIGGQAAKGHGQLRTSLIVPDEIDIESCVQQYVEHMQAVREEAVQFLVDTFAGKSAGKKKTPLKAKAKKPEPEPEPAEEGDRGLFDA